ncbi:uncharacterized protein [Penaeus vannamei]|uniref:Uncharacterized protein n=1 Tax=Penaeus vannamei TaxID=6689 RepID=A0A3R7NDE3_PENVA|nr:uncharacterized protein LOC113829280 isoform X2 [Penaeus vannamei]XP_027238209.1 uncharacterized protein LOC113829280 isoform X2 [Penaeus vannamei]ROT84182.1 hypothetical protein C7M84_022632 [Penaeus vannamei]
MSMNVGDSTDLINGGGGGIAVFWRSRTGFERKLLAVLAVLTLAVIGLVVAVAVLASEEAKCKSSQADVLTTETRLTAKFSSLGSNDELPETTTPSVKSAMEDVRWRRS